MPFEPAVECPVCETVLAPDRPLYDHLRRNHTQAELAGYLVGQHERAEIPLQHRQAATTMSPSTNRGTRSMTDTSSSHNP